MVRALLIGLTPPEEGGSEKHIYEVSSRMNGATVLTQKGSDVENKIEIPVLKGTFWRNISFALWTYLYGFWLLVSPKKFEVIHVHENLLYFLAPLLKVRYKVVVTVHGMEGFGFYDKPSRWKWFSWGLSFADVVVAVNLEDQKKLKRFFKRVVYVPNGVDLSVYRDLKSKVEEKVSFVGRMHEQKGIVYLLEAFSALQKKFPKLKLEMIGTVNEYGKEMQKRFPSKQIVWRGFVGSKKELARMLSSAKVICLPSLWEGLPLVLFESLASGRPLVLSKIPAFTSVVRDEVAFARVKDSKDLTRALSEVLKDQKKAATLGKRGKALSENYDWGVIAKQLEDVYEEIS